MKREAFDRPVVSVIVPVFNRAHGILRTLDSLWEQSFRDFEVLIIDDGSTDDLVQVLATVDDSRLRYVHQPNSGPAAARNTGVDHALGAYIAYLDSDDRLFSHHLEASVSALRTSGADVVYSPMVIDRGVGRFLTRPTRSLRDGESFPEFRWEAGELILTSSLVVEASITRDVRWNERLVFGDVDQYLHDLYLAADRVLMLEDPCGVYDDHTGPEKLSQLWLKEGSSSAYTNFLDWFNEHRSEFSVSTQRAFDARVATSAEQDPVVAMAMILTAQRSGAISASDGVREFARSRWPTTYRRLTDTLVFLRGDTLDKVIDVRSPSGEGASTCLDCERSSATTVHA